MLLTTQLAQLVIRAKEQEGLPFEFSLQRLRDDGDELPLIVLLAEAAMTPHMTKRMMRELANCWADVFDPSPLERSALEILALS